MTDHTPPKPFEISVADFRTRARTYGSSFWRGVAFGFVAGFPIAYIGVIGGNI